MINFKKLNNQTKKRGKKTPPKIPQTYQLLYLLLLLLLLLLEILIACSYDIKSARNNLWLPYLYYFLL